MSEEFRKSLVVDSDDYSEGRHVERKDYHFKPYYTIEDDDRVSIYEKHYENQIPNFESYLEFINKIMCALKHYRMVTGRTNFTARIKSVDSALENDVKKALNDVFGIGINAGIAGESEFLYLLLSSTLSSTRDVVKNKENGYAAHHFSGFPQGVNLAERLKQILNTKFDPEEMYQEYLKQSSDNELKKIKLDKNEEQVKQDDKKDLEEEKQELEEENTEEKQDIRAYFYQYYNALNKYIEKKKIIIKGAKLKALEKEIKAIENEYYKNKKFKIKDDRYQPIIEIQFKTIAVSEEATNGTADHGDYKGIEIEDIQKEYDLKGRLPSSSLPAKMYESNLETDEYGNPLPVKRISDHNEKAEKLYPFLIVNRKTKEQDLTLDNKTR